MATPYDLDNLKIKEKLDFFTIPNLIIYFVLILGVLHVIAALISNRPIAEFAPLRTPIMLIIYAMVVFIVITLIQWGQTSGIRDIVTSGNVLVVMILLFIMLVYVAYFNKAVLPAIFSIVP